MQLSLDADQQLLQDSVARFVAEGYGFEARTRLVQAAEGGSVANWRRFAENGWLGAAVPEPYGGSGGTVIDTVIISQQLGRGLVLEPHLGCAVFATQLLLAAGSPGQCSEWLPTLVDGSRRLAVAYSEPAAHGLPELVAAPVERSADGCRLHGRKTLVLGAPAVDGYLVAARESHPSPGAGRLGLFLVRAGSPGLAVTAIPLHDGTQAAELVLDGVVGEALPGDDGQGLAALREALCHAMLALCAELVGGMERAIEVTAEYLRSRRQFNVPLAGFQALQHRMADMAAEMELARSMLFAALAAHAGEAPAERYESVSAAKAFVTRAARSVCAQAIQLHGGIGMTEEYVVGHFFKRAVVADLLLGSSAVREAAHARRLQGLVDEEHRAATPTWARAS
jgi:alkylation response protein AidB-like acyl-CoA dehydrogenase